MYPALFNLGYESPTIEAINARLQTAQVKDVMDVREPPLSRKKSFFNRLSALPCQPMTLPVYTPPPWVAPSPAAANTGDAPVGSTVLSNSFKPRALPMTGNTSMSLGEHFNAFIEQQISHGRYGSASEVVRAGLRQLEDNETRLSALRAALADGENSGASIAFDVDAFLKAKRRTAAGKATAKLTAATVCLRSLKSTSSPRATSRRLEAGHAVRTR